MKTILRLAQQRDQLSIVDDQIGSPTGAELVADITAHVLRTLKYQSDVSGIYHLVAKGETSWFEFAKFILQQAYNANFSLKVQANALSPIPSSAFPLPAKRPLNSRLNTSRLEETFGLNLPEWEISASRTLAEILNK